MVRADLYFSDYSGNCEVQVKVGAAPHDRRPDGSGWHKTSSAGLPPPPPPPLLPRFRFDACLRLHVCLCGHAHVPGSVLATNAQALGVTLPHKLKIISKSRVAVVWNDMFEVHVWCSDGLICGILPR